jgi:hypothetical protein
MNPEDLKPIIKGKAFWGPPVWKTIHIFAATLRPENAAAFATFLECLTELLPCEECKKNLAYKLKHYPPEAYLSNNDDAFFYSYILHDLANEQITAVHPETPKESPDFDVVKNYFFTSLSQECKGCSSV